MRQVYAEVLPRVEYSLTEYGRTLEPIMIAMRNWGAEHLQVQDLEKALEPKISVE